MLKSSSGLLKGRTSIEIPRSWASWKVPIHLTILICKKCWKIWHYLNLKNFLALRRLDFYNSGAFVWGDITFALCIVVLIISIFVTPVKFPKGSSSFVNNKILLSAVFADLIKSCYQHYLKLNIWHMN